MFEFTIADNFDVVTLFEGGGANNTTTKSVGGLGLIAILNEECMHPNGTDNSFVHHLKKNMCNSSRLITDKLYKRFEFGIKHFAGCVTYDANKFLQVRKIKLCRMNIYFNNCLFVPFLFHFFLTLEIFFLLGLLELF